MPDHPLFHKFHPRLRPNAPTTRKRNPEETLDLRDFTVQPHHDTQHGHGEHFAVVGKNIHGISYRMSTHHHRPDAEAEARRHNQAAQTRHGLGPPGPGRR